MCTFFDYKKKKKINPEEKLKETKNTNNLLFFL